MHTYGKNIGGNIYYGMDKISGINASILLYCSKIYKLYISKFKGETIRN